MNALSAPYGNFLGVSFAGCRIGLLSIGPMAAPLSQILHQRCVNGSCGKTANRLVALAVALMGGYCARGVGYVAGSFFIFDRNGAATLDGNRNCWGDPGGWDMLPN